MIKMTDLGEDVARAVIAAVDAGDRWRAALDPLRALEATSANRSGVATKILAFADMPDGRAIVERIAATVRPHFPLSAKRASDEALETDCRSQKARGREWLRKQIASPLRP